MLKKMRRRVIGAAMIAFSAVILLIALLVNAINYSSVTKKADDTLERILEYEEHNASGSASEKMPPPPFMELADVESNYMTRFFSVRVSSEGEVLSTSTDYIATIDRATAIDYAGKAMQKSGINGYIGVYRYLKKSINGVTTICFLNTIREQEFMTTLLTLTAAVVGASLVLVFILVYILSAKAIRPYAANIERQKQFITDASHELKTPLTSISTSIDVIALEHGEDEWTENIKKQTGRMSQLVGELLTLSKLNEGIPAPNKETFSLSDAAWEVAEIYRSQAKAGEKELEIDIRDDLTLFGEKESIQKMLSVLLDNALRYSTEKSSIGLKVTGNKGKTRIVVNNPCHFEAIPDTERLFDRFYRPDASRNEKTGGTGVGLAIAKAVAEAQGGNIKADCPNGEEMTITVEL